MPNTLEDLNDLHKLLVSTITRLGNQRDDENDPAIIQAIGQEIGAIAMRVNSLQQVIIAKINDDIAAQLRNVDEASGQLKKDLKNIDAAASIITGVGKFLSYVDQVIQLAKLALV